MDLKFREILLSFSSPYLAVTEQPVSRVLIRILENEASPLNVLHVLTFSLSRDDIILITVASSISKVDERLFRFKVFTFWRARSE